MISPKMQSHPTPVSMMPEPLPSAVEVTCAPHDASRFDPDGFERSQLRVPSARTARLSREDRPYDSTTPHDFDWAAERLASTSKQPSRRFCKRRAKQYAAMTRGEVESAVRNTLQKKTVNWRYCRYVAACTWHLVRPSDEGDIAVRELYRRGGDLVAL